MAEVRRLKAKREHEKRGGRTRTALVLGCCCGVIALVGAVSLYLLAEADSGASDGANGDNDTASAPAVQDGFGNSTAGSTSDSRLDSASTNLISKFPARKNLF